MEDDRAGIRNHLNRNFYGEAIGRQIDFCETCESPGTGTVLRSVEGGFPYFCIHAVFYSQFGSNYPAKRQIDMNTVAINQKKALDLLKKGEHLSDYEIRFDDEKVEALDALLLRKNGINLPEELVYYADEEINFEDDADLTEEDLEQGRLIRVLHAEIPVDQEVADWVRQSRVDLNGLLSDLIKGFYQNMKSVSKT